VTWPVGHTHARVGTDGSTADILVQRWPDTPQVGDVGMLNMDERRRLDRFERPRDAAAFAAGRTLLRHVAARRLGCGPEQVHLVAPQGTQPRIHSAPLACSIAHGGALVLAAVTDAGLLGIDVEPVDLGVPTDELADIASTILGAPPDEVAALRSGGAAHAFVVRWTLTEAVLKALGTGFAADPGDVRIDLRDTPRLISAPGLTPAEVAGWRLHLLPVAPGHLVALACSHPVLPRVAWRT
jgi:4'-phosphopantetheinyl transferase